MKIKNFIITEIIILVILSIIGCGLFFFIGKETGYKKTGESLSDLAAKNAASSVFEEEKEVEEEPEEQKEELAVDYETAYKWVLENSDLFEDNLVKTAKDNPGLSRALYIWGNELYVMQRDIYLTKEECIQHIPNFYQWDDRWGYDSYGGNIMTTSGCGPTAMAMVAVGLLRDYEINPRVVAKFAIENKHIMDGTGTMWALFEDYSAEVGLKYKDLGNSATVIAEELEAGHPVICSVRKGTFTYGGHFIVLVGYDDDGMVIVNDPMSKERSAKTWDLESFKREIKHAWSFSK